MTKPKIEWRFDAGCALSRELYWIHGAAAGSGKNQDAASRMVFYQHQAANPWSCNDLQGWPVQALCFPKSAPGNIPKVFALSRRGEVQSYSRQGVKMELIAEAGSGLGQPDWNPVTRIREIGAHLHVCGHGGQVYRREAAGWVYCGAQTHKQADGSSGGAWAEPIKEVGDLSDINGPDENAIYTVGADGYMAFCNGADWIEIPKVTAVPLNFILAQPGSDMVWVAGNRGTLLKGNVKVGFFGVIAPKYWYLDFYSVALFQERLFIGASDGIYEIINYRPQRLPVSDTHALDCIKSMEAKDGVLWALGARKLARYDGAAWQVFESPYL